MGGFVYLLDPWSIVPIIKVSTTLDKEVESSWVRNRLRRLRSKQINQKGTDTEFNIRK